MRQGHATIRLSSDSLLSIELGHLLRCHHASFLDVKAMSEDVDKAEAGTTDQLLQQKGFEHEGKYLQQLKD